MALSIITQPDEINFTRNPIILYLTCDTIAPNIRVQITITLETNVLTFMLYTDVNGEIITDLRKYIDDMMPVDYLAWPTYGVTSYMADDNLCKDFSIEAIQLDDTESEPVTGTYTAVKGGVTNQLFPVYKFWTDYLAAADNVTPFITWNNISKKKRSTPTSPEFLSFLTKHNYPDLYPDPSQHIGFKYHAYNNISGSLATGYIPETSLVFIGTKKLIRNACGLGNVPAFSAAFDIADCDYMDVWVEAEDDGVISEARRYYIDHTKHVHTHHFVFINSLGGIDTLTTHGAIDITPEVSRNIIKKYTGYGYPVQSGNLQAFNINTKSTFKAVHTSQSWYEHLLLQDMMASPLVFKFENGQYKPIIITSSKVPLGNPDNYIHTCEFDYILAYDNTQYTPDQLFPV